MRVIDYFDRGAALNPDRDFLVDGDVRQSYAETQSLSWRIAGALYDQAFQPGDAVAVYSPNDARAFNCILGLFRAGDPEPAATGYFVHVCVDRKTRRPVPVPDAMRALLTPLVMPD